MRGCGNGGKRRQEREPTMRLLNSLIATGLAAFTAGVAAAQDLPIIGQPVARSIAMQPAATELARDIQFLDHFLLWIITPIVIFVTGLLIWCVVRYNRRANPTPARFTHNSPLEVAWTLGPVVILVVIGVFSLPILFKQQEIPQGDVTIKVSGHQWYWSYDYVDAAIPAAEGSGDAPEPFTFSSYMIGSPNTGGANMLTPEVEAQLAAKGYDRNQWLLATDTSVVVPVGKTVVMQVTSADVIHSWKIPAFGVMQDGVPGRLAHLWFKAEKEGIFFGQCSELCGQMHAYMPITVKVVSEEAYAAWLAANQEVLVRDGGLDGTNFIEPEQFLTADAAPARPVQVAANE
jgi:cytochrome c oxidase subunit 2